MQKTNWLPLHAAHPDSGEATRWTLLSPEIDPGYAAAMAVEHVSTQPEEQGLEFRMWDCFQIQG